MPVVSAGDGVDDIVQTRNHPLIGETRNTVWVMRSRQLRFLQDRDRRPELMDQPGIDPAEHRAALVGLRRVNWVSGGVPAIWRELRRLSHGQSQAQPLRVLDIACGGGDVVIRLAHRAMRERLPIVLDGCDLSPTAVTVAQAATARSQLTGVRFFQHDALGQPLPTDYDVLMCSLFLHHLTDDEAGGSLRNMAAAARRAVLIDDLLRTRLGFALCWVGCRLLSRSRIVHTDGPLSVRAALTLEEVRDLATRCGLTSVSLRRHWPERFLLSWSR